MTADSVRKDPRRDRRGWKAHLDGPAHIPVRIRGSYAGFLQALHDWDTANLGA